MRSLAIDSSLEGIAGVPLAMLTVPNTSSSPLDIGPTEARTLYAVGSNSALSGTNEPIANLGGEQTWTNINTGVQVIRCPNLGVGGLVYRALTSVGGSGSTHLMKAGWPWGKPLAVCGWWDGSRFGSQGYLSTPTIDASVPGSMNAAPRLRLAPITSNSTTPIAALAYRGVHDLDTRTLILNRLMQRYGSL